MELIGSRFVLGVGFLILVLLENKRGDSGKNGRGNERENAGENEGENVEENRQGGE